MAHNSLVLTNDLDSDQSWTLFCIYSLLFVKITNDKCFAKKSRFSFIKKKEYDCHEWPNEKEVVDGNLSSERPAIFSLVISNRNKRFSKQY